MPSLRDSGRLGEQKSLVTFLEVHRATLSLSSSVLPTSPGLPAVPSPGGQFILGFEILAHTQSWKRMLSESTAAPGVLWSQRDYQPRRLGSDFWGTSVTWRWKGNRETARTHAGLFTRGKWNQRSRPRGTAVDMSATMEEKQFWISDSHLLYCWWGEGRGVPWARVPVCVLGPLLFF